MKRKRIQKPDALMMLMKANNHYIRYLGLTHWSDTLVSHIGLKHRSDLRAGQSGAQVLSWCLNFLVW